MKKLLYLLILFSVYFNAQIINGTVLNEANNALQSVSVYIDGSAISTQTDTAGNFSLNIQNIKFGNLVIKKENYETIIYPFNSENLKKLKVILSPEREIEEVKLLNYSDKNYDRYINRFLNEFLGYERENVKIKNSRDIVFAYDRDQKTLKAKAKKALIIENNLLGYNVEYNLMTFSVNDELKMSSFAGTSFFKEMEGTKKQKLEWEANRLNAYYGSAMHFFRSAYQNKLGEEGFIVNHLVRVPNPKYPTDAEFRKLAEYRETLKKLKNNQSFLVVPAEIQDIQSRSRESKFALALTEHKIPTDKFITRTSGKVILSFIDLLGVVYKKYPFSVVKNKLERATIPINMSSLIDTDGNDFEISSDGNYTDPEQLIFQDDWAKQKSSLMLPLDYQPEF